MTPTWTSDDGRIQLYHADALDVLPHLAGIDAVVTDPPYGIGKDAATRRPSNYQRKAGMMAREWDNQPAEVSGLVKVAPIVVIWGGNYYTLPPSRGWLVWHKPDAVPTMANAELAWTNKDCNTRLLSWSIAATNAERVGHPTQKPVKVMQWCMEQARVPIDALVADFYMGSGTTCITCIRTGRRFIGVEKDAHYFQIAKERIQRELQQKLLPL